MKKLETILLLTIIAAFTVQAMPHPGLPPGYQECRDAGGQLETIVVERNDTGGPFSDRPIIEVVCTYPKQKSGSNMCYDGTLAGNCSIQKPFLCYSNQGLVSRCDHCLCPEGDICEGRVCKTTTSTSSTTSTTSTSTSSTTTTLSSTTSSSSSTILHVYTTSSTIAQTTSTTIEDVPEGITGKFTLTRGRGTLIAGVIVLLVGYALIKINPSSRDAS